MAKQDTGIELKQDEFSKIFDEYRAKIEEITRRTEKTLSVDDAVPGNGRTDDSEHIEVISAPSRPESAVHNDTSKQVDTAPPARPEAVIRPESDNNNHPVPSPAPAESAPKTEPTNTRSWAERPAFGASAEILSEAKYEAKRIIEEAEESARKEAKKRTQSQVDKIIEKAKKEADDIIARANREAEKVRDEVIAESKREADYIIREITQKYRQETEAQASRAMAEAQEKAGIMLADISASTQQVGRVITEIVTKAKKTINEMETNLQTEAADLTRIVIETQARLEEVGKNAREEKVRREEKSAREQKTAREEKTAPMVPEAKPTDVISTNPTLAVRLIGETTSGNNGNGALFSGQMEMKSISAEFDYQYLKKLKKYLVRMPNIKYLQEYASEKEMSVVFDILEPLPLLDILSNIPLVDEVITRADDDICLIFKNIE